MMTSIEENKKKRKYFVDENVKLKRQEKRLRQVAACRGMSHKSIKNGQELMYQISLMFEIPLVPGMTFKEMTKKVLDSKIAFTSASREDKKRLKETKKRVDKEHRPLKKVETIPEIFVSEYRPTEQEIHEFYDSWEWQKLSYEVKLQRGRICECCGAKAPKVRIITDHIYPLRKYWDFRLDYRNMQVLCDDCNRGKASRDSTDFRVLNSIN